MLLLNSLEGFFFLGFIPLSFILAFSGIELGIAFYLSTSFCNFIFRLYKRWSRFRLKNDSRLIYINNKVLKKNLRKVKVKSKYYSLFKQK